jgi:pilus assembly protein Flp/PilA
MRSLITRILRNEQGATAIEYGLIAGLIAVACVSSFQAFASGETAIWNIVETRATEAMDQSPN